MKNDQKNQSGFISHSLVIGLCLVVVAVIGFTAYKIASRTNKYTGILDKATCLSGGSDCPGYILESAGKTYGLSLKTTPTIPQGSEVTVTGTQTTSSQSTQPTIAVTSIKSVTKSGSGTANSSGAASTGGSSGSSSKTTASSSSSSSSTSGVYTYDGQTFPYMPSDFVFASETTNYNSSGTPAANYTNANSLTTIESQIITVCNNNSAPLQGGFDEGQDDVNGKDVTTYELVCTRDTTGAVHKYWKFVISSSGQSGVFDVTVNAAFTVETIVGKP